MIFRAKLPKRKVSTRFERDKSQSKFFAKIPDELYNEALLDIYAISEGRKSPPLHSKRSPYVFAICDIKPIDSENLTWEGITGNFPDVAHPERYNRGKTCQRREKRSSKTWHRRLYIERKKKLKDAEKEREAQLKEPLEIKDGK